MGIVSLFRPHLPQQTQIEIGGRLVSVSVRVNPRARAYRLALSTRNGPVLTVPRGGRWQQAEAFLLRNRGWLEARLEKLGSAPELASGAIVPLRGVPHSIVSHPGPRGVVAVVEGAQGPELHVPGGEAHLRRRLVDWLKLEAKADLEIRCAAHAKTLGVRVASIRLRDQSTRWGSCSSTGALNFNWRLIMAPDFVLDYVAAHEVAHILEMNHAPAFWKTVARALPDYDKGQHWLKANGQALLAIK